MILSVVSVAFFTVSAVNAAGIPLAWSAPLPGSKLSLLQIFLLIAMLVAVFWISSHTKRSLFNRFLANSGLNHREQLHQRARNATLGWRADAQPGQILDAPARFFRPIKRQGD